MRVTVKGNEYFIHVVTRSMNLLSIVLKNDWSATDHGLSLFVTIVTPLSSIPKPSFWLSSSFLPCGHSPSWFIVYV